MKPRSFLDLPDDWESMLDMRLLIAQTDPTRRKAYVCSPCRADSSNGVYGNMLAARYYMYYVYTNMNLCPCAPHAYLPVMLSDTKTRERKMALNFGIELLAIADELLVCGHITSDGMRGEIKRAEELGIPIKVFSPIIYEEVKGIAGYAPIHYIDGHISLVLNAGELFEMEA